MKTRCIVIDLDGTLANCDVRREKLLNDNDWDDFNSRICEDKLNDWCREIIQCFKDRYSIIVVTGRKELHKQETIAWLFANSAHYDEIFFRATDDFRDDAVVKKEIYLDKIDPFYEVLFVVDDRRKVVEMWRKLGLVCLQCDFGDF